MKKQKKKMLGISPVIATMLMIVIAIVLLLLIYTWLYAWQQIQTAKETVKIRNVSVDKIRVSGIQLNEVASDEKYVQYLYLNNHSDYDINSVYVFIGAETV
ncbi:hypothetical protein JXA85_07295, partial [Candidatus Woesearchaeota archaeon]|nr:hypothetical protein [Candidatus Woesearchaeota archaeon]